MGWYVLTLRIKTVGSEMTSREAARTISDEISNGDISEATKVHVLYIILHAFTREKNEMTSQGLELEGQIAATDDLTLGASMAYLKAEYDSFEMECWIWLPTGCYWLCQEFPPMPEYQYYC